MSLNPSDDILTQIIKSYEGYADMLRGQERKEFEEMLKLCYRYAEAINVKGESFHYSFTDKMDAITIKVENGGENEGVFHSSSGFTFSPLISLTFLL